MKRTPLRPKSLNNTKKNSLHSVGLFPKIKEVRFSRARERAATAFQKYIRIRDGVKTTGTTRYAKCFTCPKTYPTTGKGCIQGGHFIPGRRGSILFDERNCHAQCYNCNMNLKGNWVIYRRNMVTIYGEAVIKELESLNEVIVQYTVPQLLAMEQEFNNKTNDLLQKYL